MSVRSNFFYVTLPRVSESLSRFLIRSIKIFHILLSYLKYLLHLAKAFISSEFFTKDMKVDVKNIHILIMRLRIQLNAHGMQLNSDEFEELVYQNNDVGHIIRKCGEFLDTKSCSTQSSLVSIDPDVLKGSVEVARGRRPSLQSEPSVRWHSLFHSTSQVSIKTYFMSVL